MAETAGESRDLGRRSIIWVLIIQHEEMVGFLYLPRCKKTLMCQVFTENVLFPQYRLEHWEAHRSCQSRGDPELAYYLTLPQVRVYVLVPHSELSERDAKLERDTAVQYLVKETRAHERKVSYSFALFEVHS